MNFQVQLLKYSAGHTANDWPIAALWIIVPAAASELDLTSFQIGVLFTLFSFIGACSYIPAGNLADRCERLESVATFTFFWVSIGYCLAAAAPGYWTLALLLSIAGMGNSFWHPVASVLLLRDNEGANARALSFFALGGSVAEILAPLTAGSILSAGDWRVAMVISCIPTVIGGVAFYFHRPRPRDTRFLLSRPLRNFDSGSRDRSSRILLTVMILFSIVSMGLMSMVPHFLISVHEFKADQIGMLLAALLFFCAIIQVPIGALSDKFGRVRILFLGNFFAAFTCAFLIFASSAYAMIILTALTLLSLESVRATGIAAIVDRGGERRGRALGVKFMAIDGVGSFGALLSGTAASYSWKSMFVLFLVTLILAAFLTLFEGFGEPSQ